MRAPGPLQLPSDAPGSRIYELDLAATAIFVVAAIAAIAVPSTLRIAYAVLACVLFGIGCIVFLWAYGVALNRSRHEAISVAGIYGLSESTPAPVQRRFHLLTAVQTAAAVVAAALHPFTAHAFGILVPMLGLGLGGLWAARHGSFGRRVDHRRNHLQPKDAGSDA